VTIGRIGDVQTPCVRESPHKSCRIQSAFILCHHSDLCELCIIDVKSNIWRVYASKFEDIQELASPHEVYTDSAQTRVTRLALPAVSHDLLVAYLVALALASPSSPPAPSNAPSVGLTRPQLPSINLTVHHQPNAYSINLMRATNRICIP
jgi:hypothetical protein